MSVGEQPRAPTMYFSETALTAKRWMRDVLSALCLIDFASFCEGCGVTPPNEGLVGNDLVVELAPNIPTRCAFSIEESAALPPLAGGSFELSLTKIALQRGQQKLSTTCICY